MIKKSLPLIAALGAIAGLVVTSPAGAQERTVKIAGFGAKSGVVRVFGINSEAALKAAAEQINNAGGVTLGDGSKGKFAIEFLDDRCNAEEGISVVRRIASTDAVRRGRADLLECRRIAVRHSAEESRRRSDTGLQFPIIADVAAKGGLAKISEWAFRNVPSEFEMYKSLFAWVKTQHPDAQDDLWRRREGFRAFERHLRRHEGAGRSQRLQVLGQGEWLLERHHVLDPGARDEARQPRHRGDLGASVHHLRRAQGDGAPGRQAEAADRAYLVVAASRRCRAAPSRPKASSSRPASRR